MVVVDSCVDGVLRMVVCGNAVDSEVCVLETYDDKEVALNVSVVKTVETKVEVLVSVTSGGIVM
jgi:hypothetical protein